MEERSGLDYMRLPLCLSYMEPLREEQKNKHNWDWFPYLQEHVGHAMTLMLQASYISTTQKYFGTVRITRGLNMTAIQMLWILQKQQKGQENDIKGDTSRSVHQGSKTKSVHQSTSKRRLRLNPQLQHTMFVLELSLCGSLFGHFQYSTLFFSSMLIIPSMHHTDIQWARKALQCLAVLDYLWCGALQCGNLTQHYREKVKYSFLAFYWSLVHIILISGCGDMPTLKWRYHCNTF